MAIKEVRLSNGFSCFVGDTAITFNMRHGQLTLPVVAFCTMDFEQAKNWLSAVGIEIDRDDFRSVYFDGGLSLANLLNHGLIKDDING
ncbi:polymerase [Escherichia phage phiEco32]|uniref:Uncharacterized protein n=1 Tax=Escherichia phage Phieco32 TaxID=2679905 RepID=B0FIT9_BPE32|nr:polymerase [Escherichia phage phiEco32]ABY52928.1 hypothetical protein phi32_127 [Escherichia phage phiEco32]